MRKLAIALALVAGPAMAEDAIVTGYDGSFEDAAFAVENAIVNAGLVIDYVSHVGEMLNRTGADVGSDAALYTQADVFLFCSAVVSRQVMEADPLNLVHCPYGIAVAETAEGVLILHRDYPEGAMQAVEDLLAGIVAEAAAF
ncbi:hypothetical protein SAMN04515673_105229 [Poseidonocella sedimentorum]|uniref:DUF302 domain-containing protein n=2 Tax=Poseidonocella sedimentorum TaxID=871652 RepID=A0A1I6DVN8_9RHOB|nr:DUF302 domain-containing protein [Poseidonocella sedimentorum]SFR09412.1 hypothetical protein SAMN04515673_105229 [Poseidonocella sedimentorum]